MAVKISFSRAEIAEALGVTGSAVSHWKLQDREPTTVFEAIRSRYPEKVAITVIARLAVQLAVKVHRFQEEQKAMHQELIEVSSERVIKTVMRERDRQLATAAQ